MKKKYFFRNPNAILLLVLITAVFFSFSLPAYCQENNQKKKEQPRLTPAAQKALVKANDLLNKNDYAGAREPLIKYLATKPKTIPVQVYRMLSYCWYNDQKLKEKERLEKAIEVAKKGYESYPENYDILQFYAILVYQAQHFAVAAPLLEKVYDAQKKKNIDYLNYAMSAYYQAKELRKAKKVLLRMISISEKPKKEYFSYLVQICQQLKQDDEAQKYLYEGLNAYPMDVRYWEMLAGLRENKNDYMGAAGAYDIKTHVKIPEKEQGWKNLIGLYRYVNVPLRVASAMRTSLENSKMTDKEYISIANDYARAMRVNEAVSFLDSAISKTHSKKLMMAKAKILYDARKNKEAIKAFDDLIAVDPKVGGEIYYDKGLAAWDLEEWDVAKNAFVAALRDKKYRSQAKNALDVLQSLADAKSK